jgi:hypothetical protein
VLALTLDGVMNKEDYEAFSLVPKDYSGYQIFYPNDLVFKLIDLEGFAQGYSTYDLLAKRWYEYGYFYPFIELGFGILMIVLMSHPWLLILEIMVMTISGLGVAIKLAKKEHFQCACLGTFLKVPLTKITLIEDFGMALLAGILLIWS